MSRKPGIIVSALLLLLMCVPAFAVVNITIENFMNNAQIVYVADLDLLQTGTAPELFRLRITSTAPIVNPRLKIELSNGNNEMIAFGTLNLDAVQPSGGWVISNQNFSRGDGSWESNDELSSEYQNQVLRTGMIPIDTYRFRFVVLSGNQEVPNATERLFSVRGMGYVQLRFPDHDLRGQTPIPSTLPFFVWQSSQEYFSIKISEMGTGETPETALQNRTNCEATGLTSTSFQYPTSGVVPLDPGKYYAWQVTARVVTSHGTVDVPSEIRVFRIAPVITPEGSQLMVGLQQLLTSGPGARILELMQNGNPDGVIYVNGVPISVQQFFAMLSDFISGRYTIVSMRVE